MMDLEELMLTKIVATVGPASLSAEKLRRLIDEGVRLFRINFSHGKLDDFAKSLALIREVIADETLPAVGVLGDLCGPKIRIGKVVEGGVRLEKGNVIAFCEEEVVGGTKGADGEILFSTNTPEMIEQIEVGDRLLIDDGSIRALVVERVDGVQGQRLIAHVVVPGLVTSSKGINLPDTKLTLPSITDWDWECARWAVENGLDFLALSFVRSARDVEDLKAGLSRDMKELDRVAVPPVVAKIEKPQAVDDLEAIIDAADGIMVARGDLGVEMDLAEVPVIQKRAITLAHQYGKPVIVATQMLQSMIDAPIPTRAEVSDVANAIFDGVDAVMLSGETAVGKYPIQAVAMMAKTARLAEANVQLDPGHARLLQTKLHNSGFQAAALMGGVSSMVKDLDAKLVVMWSQSGGGARLLSQRRLGVPIIAFSTDRRAVGKMSLLYGVQPRCREVVGGIEELTGVVDQLVVANGWARAGDTVLIVLGQPVDEPGATNQVAVHKIMTPS